MSRNDYFELWIVNLLLVCLFPIFGQAKSNEISKAEKESALYESPPELEEAALQQTNLSGVGLTVINGDPFIRTQLQPEADLGKIGFGLGFVLLYNPNAEDDEDKIFAEDAENWDNLSTFLRTVRYVRYGQSQRVVLRPIRGIGLCHHRIWIHHVRLF